MWRLRRSLLLTSTSVLAAAASFLVSPAARAAAEVAQPYLKQLRVGFDNNYKAGYWTPVWITLAGGQGAFRGRLELVVPDGDGVQTRFVDEAGGPIRVAAGAEKTFLRYVKIGRVGARVEVRLVLADGKRAGRSFSPEAVPPAAPSSYEMIVSYGGDIGVDEAIERRRRRRGAARQTIRCRVQSARDLPDHWIGYDGVDTLVITTSRIERVRQLTGRQLEAIRRWVHLGGRLVLCVGRNGKQVLAGGGPLSVFAPGRFDRVGALKKTVELETYAKATQRLDHLPGADRLQTTSLRDVRGRIECQGAALLGQGPTIVRSPFGFGQVVFVAVDLDQPPFLQWQGRPRMVARILQESRQEQEAGAGQPRMGKVAHEGYDDIIGQLRAAMDQFQGVTLVSFTAVATLTVLYVLLIGPGDYFLLKRMVGRMEWTWVTFPLAVLLFCGLAYCLVVVCKPRQIRVNQVELIDVDAASSAVRGTMWAHIYSPATETYDLSFVPAAALEVVPSDLLLSWQGLPGAGFGGMNTRSIAEQVSRPYGIVSRRRPDGSLRSTVARMPIRVASSKTLGVRWQGRLAKPIASRLWFDRRDDSLRGRLTNPLDVALSDCRLAYGSWTYRLDRKLAPGETVDVREQMSERSLNLYLTRHSVEEQTAPWDQASKDVPRILEIMMYHRAAGGRAYTSLAHRYQRYVDLSSHLGLGRAILTGWTAGRSGELRRDGKSLARYYDQQWTFYRIVLPVEGSLGERPD